MVSLLLFVPAICMAQMDRRVSREYRAPKKPEKVDVVAKSIEIIAGELSLDSFQQAVVRNLIEENQDEQSKIMSTDAPAEAKSEKLLALQRKFNDDIKKILTPEQAAKYDALTNKKKK
jgi:Spy/CpxP family protein refolding chaperone